MQIGPLRPAPRGSRLEHARSSVLGGPERDSQSRRHQALRSGRTPGSEPSALSTQDTSGAQRRGHLELATARESEARARAQDASRHPQPASQCARRRARVLGLGPLARPRVPLYTDTGPAGSPPCPQRRLAPGSLSRAQLGAHLASLRGRASPPSAATRPRLRRSHYPDIRTSRACVRAGGQAGACVRAPACVNACVRASASPRDVDEAQQSKLAG